jgi:predicted NUDIX family phosphoesterase
MSLRYPDEHVLVVPRPVFDQLGSFQGLSFEVDRYLPVLLDPANNYFLQRDEAEHDPGRKQIIPYALFHHRGRFLRYVRSKKSGEQRLAAKASLGIGGHINRDDHAASSLERSLYMAGVEREVAEELTIEGPWTQRIVALLNDDSNEVGQVHLGVVHLVEVESDRVLSNEDTIADVAFFSPDELRAERERLETWSQLCLDSLERLAGGANA